MDNQIKPPGRFGPIADPSAEPPVEPKRDTTFAEARDKLQASGAAKSPSPSFAVAAQFDKAALQDPAKVELMVRASVTELIDSTQSTTGPLSGSQKTSLLEFLSADPTVRRQIETYLRKILA